MTTASGARRLDWRRSPLGRTLLCVVCVLYLSACKEEGVVAVRRLDLKGVKSINSAALKRVLATRVGSILPWSKKRYFDRARFDSDLKRIQAFYADRGYPDARVTSFDVRLNDRRDSVDLTVTIEEGAPVRMASIGWYGFDAVAPRRGRSARAELPFKAGDVRDRQLLNAAQAAVVNRLKDEGFAYARAWITERAGAPGEVVISITADTGPIVHFGAIDIVGNRSVGEQIVRREMAYRPGDVFSRSAMLDAQRNLFGLQLFQFANIQMVDADEQPPELQTRVVVAEGKHQTMNVGVGYGTEEKGRVDGEYRHVNFLGGARSAGMQARWSSLDRGVRLTFTQPYFLFRGYSLTAEGQQWYTYTPAYRSVISGGRATVIHQPRSRRHSWSGSLIAEHDTSEIANDVLMDLALRNALIALGLNPTTGRQDGTLNALAGGVQLNGTTNPASLVNPQRGYQFSAHVEQAGRIVPGTFKYYSLSADVRHYAPVGRALSIANRAQYGAIDGIGDESSSIPFSKRYFLGGATTVRGWGRYEISPLSGSGLPLGGDSLFAFSSEARVTVTDKFGVVGFVDAGNVWSEPWTLRLTDLRYAVGPGLRYTTPVGPLRFDVGYQLNPIPGLLVNGSEQRRRWRLHFSIGQAF